MADVLMVRCKACGEAFSSPLQTDRRAFEAARPGEMRKLMEEGKSVPDEVVEWHSLTADVQCPSCGETRSYEKPDYFFQTP
jgi:hypothetical protein